MKRALSWVWDKLKAAHRRIWPTAKRVIIIGAILVIIPTTIWAAGLIYGFLLNMALHGTAIGLWLARQLLLSIGAIL